MGIKAKTIKAENVVAGTQVLGGLAEDAARLAEAVKNVEVGDIEAEHIDAKNIVDGFQWVAGTAPQDVESLRCEVVALRKQIEQMLQGTSLTDADSVRVQLESVDLELQKSEPQGDTVLRGLENAGVTASRLAKVAENFKGLVPLIKGLATAAGTLLFG